MRKIIIGMLLSIMSFSSIADMNAMGECMQRAGILKTSIQLINSDFTRKDAEVQIMSKITPKQFYYDRTAKWVNKLLDSVYADPESPFADPQYNYDVFYRHCVNNFNKYSGNNALLR